MNFDPQKISVVICVYTFDRFYDALYSVASIKNQTLAAYEIIMVVDHNIKLYDEMLHCLPDDIILVENQFEKGLSGARNTGVAIAKGDIITFVDDDAVADEDCLMNLSMSFDQPNVLGVGALIKPLHETEKKSWFPEEFLWVVGCTYKGLKEGVTRNLLGACMSIRRSVFSEIGYFQSALGRTKSKLPLGNEETELCIRATNANPSGYFIFSSSVKALHRVPDARMTWSYFSKRCYAEGISKAQLTQFVGPQRSLSSEKSYVTKTLSRAVLNNLKDVFLKRDFSALLRIVAILLGLACTTAGYVLGGFGSSLDLGPLSRLHALQTKILETIRKQKVLFFGASMLAFGTAMSSALGFVYWWVAARHFAPESVGYAAAAISLMNFIGHLGEVGFGALLIGEVNNHSGHPNRLVTTGLLISFASSALLAVAYNRISTFFAVALGDIAVTPYGQAAFIAGCALTGVTLVLDQALVGLSQTTMQVVRNVIFASSKLALLIALAFIIAASSSNESAILITWIIGQSLSILLLGLCLKRKLSLIIGEPEFGAVKPLLPRVLGHHGLNLANLAPSLLLPFIVTIVLSPSINAAFYAAWTLINVAFLAPASLATMLFAAGTQSPMGLPEKLRAALGSSLFIAAGGAFGFFLFANFVLGLFNPLYVELAAPSFKLLGLSLFPIAIKYHYVAVQRLNNRMASASVLVALGCLLEIGGAILGGLNGGLVGLSTGWLIGLSLEAILMAPTLIKALELRGRFDSSRLVKLGALQTSEKPEHIL